MNSGRISRVIRSVALVGLVAWLLAVFMSWSAGLLQRQVLSDAYSILPINLLSFYLVPLFAIGLYGVARRQDRVVRVLKLALVLLFVFTVTRVVFWWHIAQEAGQQAVRISLDAAMAARPIANAFIVLTGVTGYIAVAVALWRFVKGGTADGVEAEPRAGVASAGVPTESSRAANRVVWLGTVGIIVYDAIASMLSLLLEFDYAFAAIGSFLIVAAVGFAAARLDRDASGFRNGAILGFVDSTLGWAVSWSIGPGQVPGASFGHIVMVALLATAVDATIGAVGAFAGRRVGTI